jgi:hypothetical protein
MKNNKIRAVVVGGWVDDKGVDQMITLIGAFEDLSEAYGEAYLYLDELSQNYSDEDDAHITPLRELEGETGYGMYLQNKDGKTSEYAYILRNDDWKPESHEK